MLQVIVRGVKLVLLVPALMGQTVAITDCTLIDTRNGVASADKRQSRIDRLFETAMKVAGDKPLGNPTRQSVFT